MRRTTWRRRLLSSKRPELTSLALVSEAKASMASILSVIMGCACAKERETEDEDSSKETLARILSTAGGASPAPSIHMLLQPLTTYYRVGSVFKRANNVELRNAEFLATYQQCFLKSIKKASGRSGLQQRTRLNAEADSLRRLDHPQVLKVFETMQDEDNYYLAQEKFSGGQLLDYLGDPRFRNEAMLARLMQQVFATLHYCHQQGIVHGHLTPAAIVFPQVPEGNSMKVKLTGFGEYDSVPGEGTARSGEFSAPERSSSNSEKCDIWSCGVIIYLMLSGQLPFSASSPQKQSSQDASPDILKKGVSFPQNTWGGKSREVISLLAAMLDLNPQSRPNALACRLHPWVTINVKPLSVQPSTIKRYLFGIKKIRKRSLLQSAAIRFILLRVTKDKDIENFIEPFAALDIDGDGVLGQEEVLKGFMSVLLEEDAVHSTKRVFDVLRHNNDGVLSYSEFLISAMGEKKLLTKENLRVVFNCIDRQSRGVISSQEIGAFFNIKDVLDFDRIESGDPSRPSINYEAFFSALSGINYS